MADCDPIPAVDPGEPAKTSVGGSASGVQSIQPSPVAVCFDSGPSPLLLNVVFAATTGVYVSHSWSDPDNPAVAVVPTGNTIPCAGGASGNVIDQVLLDASGTPFIRRYEVNASGTTVTVTDLEMDGITGYAVTAPVSPPDGEYLILCDQQADGTAVSFIRRLNAQGTPVADTELDSVTPYVATGVAVADCAQRQVIQTTLCEYDAANSVLLGEFVRSWVYDGNGAVLVGPIDTELDGVTPYAVAGTSVTRNCENLVDCDNDPCITGLDETVPVDPAVPVPTVFNGTGFASIQFDAPPTGVGSSVWKIDIFDGAGAYDLVVDPSNTFRSGRLMQWLTSGPGGVRPPADEIFVVRDLIGGPGGGAVGLDPATAFFQGAPVPLIIPGWAVDVEGVGWVNTTANNPFLNLRVDLGELNPQRCDLSAIDLDPANFPGVTIQDVIDGWQAVVDDHFTNAADPNTAFEVGIVAPADADIYAFGAGSPVQSDSVVLCQTVLDNVVCFDGEPEPLQSITALNPTGQVVFGPHYRRLDTGAFVVPAGAPVSCEAQALARYGLACGTCISPAPTVVAVTPGANATFEMGQTNRAPGSIIVRFVEGAGGLPATNLVSSVCDWYNAPGNESTVFVIPQIAGSLWGNRPFVIPHWAVISLDCSVPGQLGIEMRPDAENGHPGGCDLTADPVLSTLWANFVAAQTAQFNSTGHPLVQFTALQGVFQVYTFVSSGGPALRVSSCDPVFNAVEMCDGLPDGAAIEFVRTTGVDSAGNVTITDRTYDGALYAPVGSVMPADSMCRFERPIDCVVGAVCTVEPQAGVTHDFPVAGTDTVAYAAAPSSGVYTGVTIISGSNPGWVDSIFGCIATGAYALVTEFSGAFGLNGLILGGVGTTNIVQNGPGDWTFDVDMPATLADLQANCPAALAVDITASLLGVPTAQTFGTWFNQFIAQFVVGGFVDQLQTTTTLVCIDAALEDIERRALITSPCDPVDLPGACLYEPIEDVGAVNGPGQPYLMFVGEYLGAGETAFTISVDLTNEPGWLAAIAAWVADGVRLGDLISIRGTWVQNPAGPVVSLTGGSGLVLASELFTAPPLIVGNVVTFALELGRTSACRQAFFVFGGAVQPANLDQGLDEWWQNLGIEHVDNPGFTAGPWQVQADQGNMLIARVPDRVEAERVAVAGHVDVNPVNVDAFPDIRRVTTSTLDLDILGAASYEIEVLSGVVLLGPQAVPLTVGRSYRFGIDGDRGKLYVGLATGFVVDASAGDCIVWSTKTR